MDDYRLILTIGGVVASLATAWGVARTQLKVIISDVSKMEKDVRLESDRMDGRASGMTVSHSKIVGKKDRSFRE